MHRKQDAKNNPRDYGIARNFGSGLRDRRTLLGTLYGMFLWRHFAWQLMVVSRNVAWPINMTGEWSFWPVKSPFWPNIILSPVMARSTPHTYAVDPFSTEYKMASGKVALTFESVDEILMCNHSNDTSLLVLSHGTICSSTFHKIKFGNFANCWLCWLLAVKELIPVTDLPNW